MDKPSRKGVTWRIGELTEAEAINKWINEQQSIQNSLTSVVLHFIDRFGYRNITDHDIQKLLYQELMDGTVAAIPNVAAPAAVPKLQPDATPPTRSSTRSAKKAAAANPSKVQQPTQQSHENLELTEQNDTLFGTIDPNNL